MLFFPGDLSSGRFFCEERKTTRLFHCRSVASRIYFYKIKCPRNLFGFRFSAPPMRKTKSWRKDKVFYREDKTYLHFQSRQISHAPHYHALKLSYSPFLHFRMGIRDSGFFSFKILSGGRIHEQQWTLCLKKFWGNVAWVTFGEQGRCYYGSYTVF